MKSTLSILLRNQNAFVNSWKISSTSTKNWTKSEVLTKKLTLLKKLTLRCSKFRVASPVKLNRRQNRNGYKQLQVDMHPHSNEKTQSKSYRLRDCKRNWRNITWLSSRHSRCKSILRVKSPLTILLKTTLRNRLRSWGVCKVNCSTNNQQQK